MPRNRNALVLAHDLLSRCVKPGDFCIDATTGRGKDTRFLAELVGEEGKILAFDIQQEALESAKEHLETHQLLDRVTLIQDSHANMLEYAPPNSVDAITFNFGWLPGGDHQIMTRPESSIAAIEAGLVLLKPGGVMSLILYYGGDSGFVEKDALLNYLPQIPHEDFTVLVTSFANRPNNPPIPVTIFKDRS